MEVHLIDKMGTDLSVVNAARVSYDKESDWVEESFPNSTRFSTTAPTKKVLSKRDKRLINFLAKHNHWTPFGHASASFRVSAPIFVARQLVKHQVGLVWNEVSRRYVDFEPTFWFPQEWRGRPKDSKQGSEGTVEGVPNVQIESAVEILKQQYLTLIDMGVAPEQARMILPQNMYTEWVWSGTLAAWARVCNLRCAKDTQLETQVIASQIDVIMTELFPVSWRALQYDR